MEVRRARLFRLGLVVALAAAVVCSAGAGSEAARVRQRDRIVLGVAVPDSGGLLAAVESFEQMAGAHVGIVSLYQAFGVDGFDRDTLDAVAARGSTPLVTWEPWDWRDGLHQPRFSLARIASGALDQYARAWAAEAQTWGRPLLLRFAPEMNGDWRPWSETVNGNSSGDFVRAWRHLHDLFAAVGATNVSWVWSPNVVFKGSTPLAELYPGEEYVDWIGIDGYNWGTTQPWSSWQSFDQIFGPTLAEVRRLGHKPIMLAEVASADQGGVKAHWVSDFFSGLRRNPGIRAFVWFEENKEADWRIESSAAARAAFAAGVSSFATASTAGARMPGRSAPP